MRKNQSSMTASGIAVLRALESERPEGERICYDPYARRFVHPALYHFVRVFARTGYTEWRGPGVTGFLVARERYIDEYMEACLAEGIRQVVILGAGYDARAYRFEALKARAKVFEVDHPATQRTKLARLKEIFGEVPKHVTYVPVDFETETLEQCLAGSGYREELGTLFIWQGVTQYLTPDAVDGTLSFVAHHSAPGSRIIFDYMYTSLLDGTTKHGEVSKMRRDNWLMGEMLSFGIPEGTIGAYLEQRGFRDVRDANHIALHDAYFRGRNAARRVTDGYAIASATVRGEPETG